MDPCNREWFCLLPMRKVNGVNKGEVSLSKGRGTVKGNYGGSCLQHGEKVTMERVWRKTGGEVIVSSRHKS